MTKQSPAMEIAAAHNTVLLAMTGNISDVPGLNRVNLNWLFNQLNSAYGDPNWWPADSRIEMLIGAVLVQNTAWTNVERAIGNLRERGWLDAATLHKVPEPDLAPAIRASGYFKIKARRLKALCAWLVEQGGLQVLDTWPTARLRTGLLSVTGVGPETADCILVYAFKRPVFVVDAYTRRLLQRLGWIEGKPGYEPLRAVFERTQPRDAARLGQYHALIVEHAKRHCRAQPICAGCPLRERCSHASTNVIPESA